LKLIEGEHGCGLVAVGHADQGGFGRVGDKGHGDEDATADGDGDGEGFLSGPPDDRDQGGQERDDGQQRQAHGDLAGQQGAPVREVVGGHGCRGGAVGSGSLQQAM
jgi:hypothetical protein